MEAPLPFSNDEQIRYARHTILPGFGIEGQQKLRTSSVLVIGAGGLGAPILLYLSAAGVGRIGIIDPDLVSLSNLQRQVLFTVEDIGTPKVDAAARRLSALNPHITFETFPFALTHDNALELLSKYDLIADGSDNFPTRYLVNDACVLLGKTLVYGAIFQYEGQVSVFNYTTPDGKRGPNYRNVYPDPPAPGTIPSCAEGGVLGVLPGIIGSMQANEVIKLLTGTGTPLSGVLCVYDARSAQTYRIRMPEQDPYPIHTLELEDFMCGYSEQHIPEITSAQLRDWIASETPFHLVDVREPQEYAMYHIGGTLIPLASLPQQAASLPRDKPIVFVCQSGIRSRDAVQLVQSQFGIDQAFSLVGGIVRYPR